MNYIENDFFMILVPIFLFSFKMYLEDSTRRSSSYVLLCCFADRGKLL